MQNEYKDKNLAVLAVGVWKEPNDRIEKFAAAKNLTQRFLVQGAPVGKKYNVQSIPITFFIDRDGKLVDIEEGFDGPAELEAKTRKLVAGK